MRAALALPRPPALLALLSLCLGASAARADFIPWSYEWSSNPGTVLSADGGAGVKFTPLSGTITDGTHDIKGFQLDALVSAPGTHSFTSSPYTVSVKLTDGLTKESGTVNFTGALSGSIAADKVVLSNKLGNPFVKTVTLGQNVFTVTMGAFAAPGLPGSGVKGQLGADVIISPAGAGGPPSAVPEPSTLLLAGLGLSAVGLRCWRARRRRA
jgi:hypothetical protein